MKILFLGFNVGYINPTRSLLLEALGRIGLMRAFGPGFVTLDEVEAGVSRYVERFGPFDFVVSDEYVLQQFDEANPSTIRFVNHACNFDRGLLIKAIEYREFMRRSQMRRIVSLLQTDYYNVTEPFLARIDEVADFFLGWGAELITPRFELPDGRLKPGSLDAHIFQRWTDRYREFAVRRAERVISIPHIIGDEEFCELPLAGRAMDWVVVGADYDARVRARVALDAAGVSRSGRWLPYTFAGFDKLRINPYAHAWSIALLQRLFRSALTQARYGYTCGSIARMAIRKYFEMPAAGCVLVADRCQGFEELGFVDRANAVESSGSDVRDVHHWLKENPNRAQSIADAGRRLIADRHSVSARADQIGTALRLILADDFGGSCWSGGEFVVSRRAGVRAAGE